MADSIVRVQRNQISLSPNHGFLCGITSFDGKLFILRYDSERTDGFQQVDAFNEEDLTVLKPLYMKIKQPLGIVACSRYNCFYVAERSFDDESYVSSYYIHKVGLSLNGTIESVCRWEVVGCPGGLSITEKHNLLVTVHDPEILMEFTTYGSLVREVKLDISINWPCHAVELHDNTFALCHTGYLEHRICKVNASGKILQTYGGMPGSDAGQLSCPINITVDESGRLFVADRGNNRVLVLSSSLDYLTDIFARENFNTPRRLHINRVKSRLYVVHGIALNKLVVSVCNI
jgi:hypothetical protein